MFICTVITLGLYAAALICEKDTLNTQRVSAQLLLEVTLVTAVSWLPVDIIKNVA